MNENSVPKESETIAAKRAIRLDEKIRNARKRLAFTPAWWSSGVIEVVSLLFLFTLNFYTIYDFFGKKAPFTSFSGPIIPTLSKLVSLFGVELSYAIQIVNIFFHLLFPLSLYLLVRKITDRKLVAILTVLFASLPIDLFVKTRVGMAFMSVEAPHASSLAMMPLAVCGVLAFIRDGGARNLIFASISSALVALISPFGFMTFGIFASITAFSEMLLGKGRLKFSRMMVVFLFAGAFCSFWYNPAFFYWMVTGPMGEDIRTMVGKLIPISFFALPVLGIFGYLLFDRKPNLQPIFLATFFTIVFGIIVTAGGGLFPSNPSRYAAELGISLAFFAGVALTRISEYIKFKKKKLLAFVGNGKLSFYLLLVVILALVFVIFLEGGKFSPEDESVLGLWTGVERGEIWVEKDKFDGFLANSGYAITGIGVVGLSAIGVKMKRKDGV